MRRYSYIGVGLVLAVVLAGCGRYEPTSDHPTAVPTTASMDESGTVTRCEDAPRIPEDNPQVAVRRTQDEITITWGASRGWHDLTIRFDDPTCEDRPDLRQWLQPVGPFPRFEDARIVVRPGQDRAYVGYTIFGYGDNLYASQDDIKAVGPNGQTIPWSHQTATGGPSEVVAMDGRFIITPPVGPGGDADYVDAQDVQVGETVRVTFRFLDPPNSSDGVEPPESEQIVEVPFKVVSDSRTGSAVPR